MAAAEKRPESGDDDKSGIAEVYRQRADECRKAAAKAPDQATRDEWIRLANQWTYLALHTER